MQYDILLSGGRVIDPAQGIDGALDVAIQDGRVAAVQAALPRESAKEVLDVSGKLVLPGLIDTHAHVYQYVTGRFGLNADMVGVHSGVTALIDQGGPSCMTLPGFREFIVEPARSRVYVFLSAYLVGGLEGHAYPSLYRPDCLDVEATVRAARENADLVKGIKAHAELGGFARWGIEVMRLAARIGQEADLPVYIHFGQLWPVPETGANNVDADDILPQVVELLKPGDVLAHPFTRHPGGFVDKNGRVHPSSAKRWRVVCGSTLATAHTSASRWPASPSMPGLCRTPSALTCTAITRACPSQPARQTSIRIRNTCSLARRASVWYPP